MAMYMNSSVPFLYDSYPAVAPERFQGQLKGKTAIVTGGSSGIGRAVCKAFASAGASVACIARREPQLETLVEEIKAEGGHAIPIAADITETGAAKKIVSQVEGDLGSVDILVNVAGIARLGPLVDEPEDLDIWWKVHQVNVHAPALLTRAVLPGMVERKSGVIISVSSVVATWPSPIQTAYSSSKAAISKFHESLAAELEGTGVLSFAMNPGLVESELGAPGDAINRESKHPMLAKFGQMMKAPRKKQTAQLPADVCVALVCDPRCKVLNGKHIEAAQDLSPVLEEAEKEGGGRIGKERLYLVNIGIL
ncbi:hypothetical protein AC579_8417 [Pseudocercospora musae]|uniref:Ketoreductase domain-containing protein n=1 Tax=Pseudocercospora musae TaxID=113226 RepID=A0A139II18_9PEZI|nr:hypothetical protein AC579_8417 [Pseudocercospora musae]